MSDPEESRIEELVEKKIEEKLEQKLDIDTEKQRVQEKEKEDLIEKKVDEKIQEQLGTDGQSKEEEVDRRSFLKMIGLGAGGLALSSTAAGGWVNLGETAGGGSKTLKEVLNEGNTAGKNINMNGYNIQGPGNVDGVNVSGHVNSTSNPHGVTASQTGALPESDYNPETDTHSRYTDSEARSAVDNSDVSVGHADSAGDADTVDGYHASSLTTPSSTQTTTPTTGRRSGATIFQEGGTVQPFQFISEVYCSNGAGGDRDLDVTYADGTTDVIAVSNSGTNWYSTDGSKLCVEIYNGGWITLEGLNVTTLSHEHQM